MNNLVIDTIYFLPESLVADISPHIGLDFLDLLLILLFYFLLFRDELLTKKLNCPVINFWFLFLQHSYKLNSLRNTVCTCMDLQTKLVVVLLSTTKNAKKIVKMKASVH